VSGRSPYFDPRAVAGLAADIAQAAGRLHERVTIMEVCGSHTHAIAAAGLRRLLPPSVRLISGPGCPVCVTPITYVDRAEALAETGAIVCTFGDLVRVPSSRGSLETLRAAGADLRIVYSPRDALSIAIENPRQTVVFLGIGFETTAPTIVAALDEAEREGIGNFLVLSGHKTMPAPMRAVAADPELQVHGFLLPGHVSVITGSAAFEFLARDHGLPSVVVGFTPTDVLRGVAEIVRQRAEGRAELANLYARVVTSAGNRTAQDLVDRWLEPCDTAWRGLGEIPASGLGFRRGKEHRDAALLAVTLPVAQEPVGCRCGEVLRGSIDPPECPLFGKTCTPDHAVGACMVSNEGSCAAWYRHELRSVS
jgi:hydrogenase expression/formation protein HypD